MSNNLDEFESELKHGIEGYEPEYNPNAWKKLGDALGAAYPKWYYLVASSAAVLLASVAYFYFSTQEPSLLSHQELQVSEIVKLNEIQEEAQLERAVLEESENVDESKILQNLKSEKIIKPSENKLMILPIEDTLVNLKPLSSDTAEKSKDENEVQVQQEVENQNSLQAKKKPIIVLNKKMACQPFVLNFAVIDLPQNAKVKWVFSNGFVTNLESGQYSFTNSGTYTIRLDISSSEGNVTVKDEIIVKKSPIADFKYSIRDGVLELENLTSDFEKVKWEAMGNEIAEENPRLQMPYSDDYPIVMKVTNAQGCSATKKKMVNYKVNHHIFAPNAFSPDGDGVNDKFIVRYEPQKGYSYTFQVFDAVGRKLFESKNENEAWDGKNKNLESDVVKREKFLWRLIIEDERGKKEIKEAYFERLEH